MGLPYGSIPRKTVPREEQATAMDYAVLFEFGVRNVALYRNLCITAYVYLQRWMITDTQFVKCIPFYALLSSTAVGPIWVHIVPFFKIPILQHSMMRK